MMAACNLQLWWQDMSEYQLQGGSDRKGWLVVFLDASGLLVGNWILD